MEERGPAVSVTIATKDRAHELETISLPSLAIQDTRDFEVVIWDASEDDQSKDTVCRFSAEHPDISVRYFHAPRVGSCSQRNDAVRVAQGDIIFFVDDDCEVSPDGISALLRGFHLNPKAAGGALPLTEAPGGRKTRWTHLRFKYYDSVFGLRPWRYRAKVQASGAWLDAHAKVGEVDHLTGCDMAFRKNIFVEFCFNEAMQLLAPYALWEDTEFSHRVWQCGHRLFIFEGGSVVHRRAGGERTRTPATDLAQSVYNRYMVWRYSIYPFNRISLAAYLWSVVGEFVYRMLQYLKSPSTRGDYLTGAVRGYRAALEDFRRASREGNRGRGQ